MEVGLFIKQCVSFLSLPPTPVIFGVPRIRSEPQWRLSHSCSNTRSLTHFPVAPKMLPIPLRHSRNRKCFLFILFYFILFYCHIPSIGKFLGQGLNPSHSCNLHHSSDNARSFNPLGLARDQT